MSLNNCPCGVPEMWFLCKVLWMMFEGCCMNLLDPGVSSLWFGCFLSPRDQFRLHSTITFQHYAKRSFAFYLSLLNGTQCIHRKLPASTIKTCTFQCALLDGQPVRRKTLGYIPRLPSSLVEHITDRFLPGSQQVKVMGLLPDQSDVSLLLPTGWLAPRPTSLWACLCYFWTFIMH